MENVTLSSYLKISEKVRNPQAGNQCHPSLSGAQGRCSHLHLFPFHRQASLAFLPCEHLQIRSSPYALHGYFFCLECHSALLSTIQILTHKVQLKYSAWRSFLRSLGHCNLSFLNSQTWLPVVSLSWYSIKDKYSEILYDYPVLVLESIFYLCASCLPKLQQQLSILLSNCFTYYLYWVCW